MGQGNSSRADRRPVNRHLHRRAGVSRAVGSLLVVVGAAMAVAHLIAHLANMRVIGIRDLLIGFPMAAILVIIGLLLIGLHSLRE
jgi:hypothetical protein